MNDSNATQTTKPGITLADVKACIASEYYFTAADGAAAGRTPVAYEFVHSNGHAIVDYIEHTHVGHLSAEKGYAKTPLVAAGSKEGPLSLLTFCVLVLRNGFTIAGQSHCETPEHFTAEIGRVHAREAAYEKVMELLAHQRKERLYQAKQPAQAPVEKPADPTPAPSAPDAERDDHFSDALVAAIRNAMFALAAGDAPKPGGEPAMTIWFRPDLVVKHAAIGGIAGQAKPAKAANLSSNIDHLMVELNAMLDYQEFCEQAGNASLFLPWEKLSAICREHWILRFKAMQARKAAERQQ